MKKDKKTKKTKRLPRIKGHHYTELVDYFTAAGLYTRPKNWPNNPDELVYWLNNSWDNIKLTNQTAKICRKFVIRLITNLKRGAKHHLSFYNENFLEPKIKLAQAVLDTPRSYTFLRYFGNNIKDLHD